MGEVHFYHLTRQSTDQALFALLGKCLGAGWRVLVRPPSRDRVAWLDEQLWLGSDEQFLPHGASGGMHDADQPVLLCDQTGIAGFDCLIIVEGANFEIKDSEGVERICIVFESIDAPALAAARHQWKMVTGAGVVAKYWSQANGAWRMERASPAL